MRIKIASLLCVSAVLACAQVTNIRMENGTATVTMSPMREGFMRPVTGAAFSADQTTEHTQTLADGTHINNPGQTQHLYRDSEGRTRTERPFMMAAPMQQGAPSPNLVEIRDPMAGYMYVLDDQKKVAHRFVMKTAPPPRNGTNIGSGGGGGAGIAVSARLNTPDAAQRPRNAIEKLGNQTIEGVVAEGTRRTMTWPVGAQGNDRPLVNTSESWFSPELKMVVLSKFNDARNGETVTKTTNISRAEPDPALFQPPSDYTVVDEADSFTMTLKR
jgi:hypothetical protein